MLDLSSLAKTVHAAALVLDQINDTAKANRQLIGADYTRRLDALTEQAFSLSLDMDLAADSGEVVSRFYTSPSISPARPSKGHPWRHL